jgi:DNA polymerase II small subunit/DNA polymerase delta subunit B
MEDASVFIHSYIDGSMNGFRKYWRVIFPTTGSTLAIIVEKEDKHIIATLDCIYSVDGRTDVFVD